MAESSKIAALGWQQGSVVPDALREQLGVGGEATAIVVLTQDCDLVHSSYDVEPNVELIAGTLVDAADNGLRYGRNPRRLHLEAQRAGAPAVLAFSIHGRTTVPRSVLENHAPHESLGLGRDERRLLCEWVAKRYVRAALPDTFNDRAAAAQRKIEKELKRSGEHVTGLFLMIDPDEERSAGEGYRVILRVTARREALADEGVELGLVRLTQTIASALGSCDGIAVADHQGVSEAEFTLEDLRFFKRWDWDYRSHSGEPGGDIVPA